MAHRIIGLDLGAHSVKLVDFRTGFRVSQIERLETMDVELEPGDTVQRSIDALGRLLRKDALSPFEPTDTVVVSMPGDRTLLRHYSVPFTDARRVQAVVSNELADDLPWDVDDVVFDFRALSDIVKPGVLVAAAPMHDIREFIAGLSGIDVEPRLIIPAPFAYGALARRVRSDDDLVVVDFGHRRTNVSLIRQGHVVAGRTLYKGGHDLTEGLRGALFLSYLDAEKLKETQGQLLSSAAAAQDDSSHVARILAEAIAPLMSDVRHTIELLASRAQVQPSCALICGGTSQLRGLPQYLASYLECDVKRLSLRDDPDLAQAELSDEAEALGALCLGMALEQGRREVLNLRQGPFAYKTTQSVFRDKLVPIIATICAILLFSGLGVGGSLYALRRENTQLKAQLERATKRIFGESIASPQAALRKLRGDSSLAANVPEKTAVDLLAHLSETLPSAEAVQIDLTRLEIKPGKTELAGTADSQSSIGQIVNVLKEDECFADVSTGKISGVSGDKKQFSLTLKTDCF